jgi:hypothetical protein
MNTQTTGYFVAGLRLTSVDLLAENTLAKTVPG